MAKSIVLGGSGFLGSYVADELSSRGHEVVIADIVPSAYQSAGQIFLECDIMDASETDEVISGADLVYNFAGMADIDDSLSRPKETFEQNVLGNINVLEACNKHGISRYVYASSAYAYSRKGSFYGISKLASEKIIEEYAERFDLAYSIIRYGSLYGDRADEHNGIYRMLKEALETGKIFHRGDGEEVREYIHAVDASRLSVDIIENDEFRNTHLVLTGVERLRQKDVLHMISEILNDEIEIEFGNATVHGHYRVTPYSFQPNLARKLVLNSFIDLGQGLVDCIQSMSNDNNE